MTITFHKRVQFRRKNGGYSIALPGVQIVTNRGYYLISFHGYYVMRNAS